MKYYYTKSITYTLCTELCLSVGVLLGSYVLFNVHYVRLYPEYSCSQHCFVIILTSVAECGFITQINSADFASNQFSGSFHKRAKSAYELHVRPSVRPSARNNSTPVRRVSTKFNMFIKYIDRIQISLKSNKNNG